MDDTKISRAAAALGAMRLYSHHETGEIDPVTLRDYLEQIRREDSADDITGAVDATLRRMVETVLTAWNDPDRN